MKYLPFENIRYRTKLDSEEILNRINKNLEPKKTFRLTGIFGSSDHKSYEGSINGNSFKITRIISYRNSFSPRIYGVIEKNNNGSTVTIKMRLHVLVIVFMIIWFGSIGIDVLAVLGTEFKYDGQNFKPMSLMPFGLLIFGYAVVTGAFKYESIKSRKYLAKLFEAEIEK